MDSTLAPPMDAGWPSRVRLDCHLCLGHVWPLEVALFMSKKKTSPNFVRRCKTLKGSDRYERLHAADLNQTYCGKVLNEMWFVESYYGLDYLEDVTCPTCRRVINQRLRDGESLFRGDRV